MTARTPLRFGIVRQIFVFLPATYHHPIFKQGVKDMLEDRYPDYRVSVKVWDGNLHARMEWDGTNLLGMSAHLRDEITAFLAEGPTPEDLAG
jgi:hypothetical protein